MPGGHSKHYYFSGGNNDGRNRSRQRTSSGNHYLSHEEIMERLNHMRRINALTRSPLRSSRRDRESFAERFKLGRFAIPLRESATTSSSTPPNPSVGSNTTTTWRYARSSQVSPPLQQEPVEEERPASDPEENDKHIYKEGKSIMETDRDDIGNTEDEVGSSNESNRNGNEGKAGEGNARVGLDEAVEIIGFYNPTSTLPHSSKSKVVAGCGPIRNKEKSETQKDGHFVADHDDQNLEYTPHTPITTPPPTPPSPPTPPLTPPPELDPNQLALLLAPPSVENGISSSSSLQTQTTSSDPNPHFPQLSQVKLEVPTPPSPCTPDFFMNFRDDDPDNAPPHRDQESMPWLMAPTIGEIIDKLINDQVLQEAPESFESMTSETSESDPASQPGQLIPPYFPFFPGPGPNVHPVNLYFNQCTVGTTYTGSAQSTAPFLAGNGYGVSEVSPGLGARGPGCNKAVINPVSTRRATKPSATVTSATTSFPNSTSNLNHTQTSCAGSEGGNAWNQWGGMPIPYLGSALPTVFSTSGNNGSEVENRCKEGRYILHQAMGTTSRLAPPPPPPLISSIQDLISTKTSTIKQNETLDELYLSPYISAKQAESRSNAIGVLSLHYNRNAAQREIDTFAALIAARKNQGHNNGNPLCRNDGNVAAGSSGEFRHGPRKSKHPSHISTLRKQRVQRIHDNHEWIDEN